MEFLKNMLSKGNNSNKDVLLGDKVEGTYWATATKRPIIRINKILSILILKHF
jgi:hypothetical protein